MPLRNINDASVRHFVLSNMGLVRTLLVLTIVFAAFAAVQGFGSCVLNGNSGVSRLYVNT